MGYVDGGNLVAYVSGNPNVYVDSLGTVKICTIIQRCLARQYDIKLSAVKAAGDTNSFSSLLVEKEAKAWELNSKCEATMMPLVVLAAVNVALAELGYRRRATVGNADKAAIPKRLQKSLWRNPRATVVKTSSGAAAKEINLEDDPINFLTGGWYLKIYLQPTGQYMAAVGSQTESLSHYIDAAGWTPGNPTNSMNAEKYLGNVVAYNNEFGLDQLRHPCCADLLKEVKSHGIPI